MNNEFTLIDEKSKTRTAIPLLEVSLKGQPYLIYSIRRDETSDNIFISQINSSNNQEITINDITDSNAKNLINNTIKDTLEEVLVTGKINSSKLPENLTITSFQGQVPSSNFTIIQSYLFTSNKENIDKLAQAVLDLQEETNHSKEADIPQLDISKEDNLRHALSLFPEEIHPTATAPSPTSILGSTPVSPSPVIFEPQNSNANEVTFQEENKSETKQGSFNPFPPQEAVEKEPQKPIGGITFINRSFNPDPNSCDRINEKDSTILTTSSNNVINFRTSVQQLQGEHTSEEIKHNLGKVRKLRQQNKGLFFPTSAAGYITTAAIVIIGLAGVAVASFFITLSVIQK